MSRTATGTGSGELATRGDPLPVTVIRSKRRKKSSSARIVDGRIEVRIPAWLSAAQERATVDDLVARVRRARDTQTRAIDLTERARHLARTYGLPEPASIRWVTNQHRRWASCTHATGEIRVSSRLRAVPAYVLDAVIVHELAHLIEANHGPAFRELERRFPRWERADGFLEAMSMGCADERYVAD